MCLGFYLAFLIQNISYGARTRVVCIFSPPFRRLSDIWAVLELAGCGNLVPTEKALAISHDHTNLVDAMIAGIPADQVKDKMQVLTDRREALEVQLSVAPAPDPIRIHPKMAYEVSGSCPVIDFRSDRRR